MNLSAKTMRVLFGFALLCLTIDAAGRAAQEPRFACGGPVERQVWDLWDTRVRDFLEQRVLQDRLAKQGDVYALYDFQSYAHNLVSMARRCSRMARLREVARLVRIAYERLEPGSASSSGRRWVCRGGATCNAGNRLLNTEVMLDSVQILGLASSLANALASSRGPLDDEDRSFINDTIGIVGEHLERWGDDTAIKRLRRNAEATPQDAKDGSSALFFTDKELWLTTIYAELAGLLRWQQRSDLKAVGLGERRRERLDEHLLALLRLFDARISYERVRKRGLKGEPTADLDRGYWRLHKDNRYAGYEQQQKPVTCTPPKDRDGGPKMEVRVLADSLPAPDNIGWDISHARRLVPALDALDRNRTAMKRVYSLKEADLPSKHLPRAFASALVAAVWNGDTERPLFSNYWSGANGWYRVAYDNRTGQCREGYPPWGMSDAFLTGGYISWTRYRPVIGVLGRRLYQLLESPEPQDREFMAKYYASLATAAGTQASELATFTFLPSLVVASSSRSIGK